MANDGVKIAAAMAAGYVIGRTKKGRVAIAIVGGLLLAGRGLGRLGLDESRLGGVLTEVLGDVQRTAGEALNARVGQFSDTLRSQSEGLTGGLGLKQEAGAGEEGEEAEDEGDEEASDADARAEGGGGGESDEQDQEEEAPQPSRRPDSGRAAAGGRRVAQAAGRGRR